jgi:hemolysin III
MPVLVARSGYSPAERRSDAAVHILGIALVAIGAPALVAVAAARHSWSGALAAATVYAATLTAMIVCSALYNTIGQHRWTGLLKRLDHSAIYAKIAGTYTPFLILTDPHPGLLAGLWSAALAGIGLKLFDPDRLRPLALALCLGMGWVGAVAGGLVTGLPGPVAALVLTGGVLYTIGTGFYLFDRLPFHYTIWHILVLAATAALYAAVTLSLMQAAA